MLVALMTHRRPAFIAFLVSRGVRAGVGHLGFLACVAGLACALLATPARADTPPGAGSAQAVAIIRIDISGDHVPDLMRQLDAALVRALSAAGFDGVSYENVQDAIRGKPALADCASADCLRELPALVGTNQFLRLRVEASSAIYEFEILFLVAEGEGGSIKERRKDTCPVCTSEEFIDRVADNLTTLMEPFRPVPVTIASQPAGAMLIVDGRELGRAPVSGALAPGRHQVRAVLDGHLDAEQVIEVAAGQSGVTQQFEIGLTASVGDGGGGAGGGFGAWKWAAAAGAVAAVAAGGVWVGIDGDCAKEAPSGACMRDYGTQPQGIAAIGVGVALGVAAGLMFWSDGDSEADAAAGSAFVPDLVPTPGGAMGTLRFRF